MATSYDEDLTQNDFFKEIFQNHQNILKKSSEEKWVICVPRKGTIKSIDIGLNIILDHILKPQEGNNTFATMNHKEEIRLDNNYLSCICFPEDIQILFEETHYIEEYQKCIIWCVDKPFFTQKNLHQLLEGNNYNSSTPTVQLTSIHDCIDFFATKNIKILKGIQLLCNNFWCKNNDSFEMTDLQYQKDLISNLYSQCLQICLECDYLCDEQEDNLGYLENLKLAVETCMQYFLGEKLIYSINSLVGTSDSDFNKIVRNSIDISLDDLNISGHLEDAILSAKFELLKINSFRTILDKMNCLQNIFNLFTSKCAHSNDKLSVVTSDDILQIFVFLILKCNIPNCIGNLVYVKEFNFSSLECTNQNSFLIATLEGAIEFIKSPEFADIHRSAPQKSFSKIDEKFRRIYDNLKQGNRNEALNSTILMDSICHPLCTCIKCLKVETPILTEIVNESNQNFLIFSCIHDDIELLTFLLTLNFSINFQDNFGKTALHYAAEKGHQRILLLLISYDANVNILDADKNTPLHLASDRGHENCVKALIYSSHLVEINLQNYTGETPLFLATKWGYFDIIKFLLENGASVCIKNNRNLGVLKLATNVYVSHLFQKFGTEQSTDILKELKFPKIEPAKSVSNANFCGSLSKFDNKERGVQTRNLHELKLVNLLLKSIERNDLQLTFYYLGYHINSINVTEHRDIITKCHPLCNCTLCSTNKINHNQSSSEDNDDDSDINMTSNSSERLNVNFCNADGYTPLHVASKFGRTQILRKLLDSGASVNVRTYQTLYTPLHLAVIDRQLDALKELLKCGSCLIDAEDFEGNTPLYYAAITINDIKMCELLLHNGANCQKKNSFTYKTILQECREKCLLEICKLFKENLN